MKSPPSCVLLLTPYNLDATFVLSTLERQLVDYIHHPTEKEFKLESVPRISKSQEQEECRRRKYKI